MPRNASGVYTLPSGNPVVPNTTIATSWANPTLADMAQALTDSLDRNGLGGMLVSFRIADGTINAPGLAFTNELGLGIWRSGSGAMQHVSGGVNMLTVNATAVISPVKFEHRGYDTYMLTGSKSWKFQNVAGDFVFTPSASVNAEDWDAAKAITFKSTGAVDIAGVLTIGSLTVATLTVSGAASVGSLASAGAVSGTNLTATGSITAKQHTQTPVVGNITGATNVDYGVAQSHVLTLTGPAVITPINVPVGSIIRMVLIATNLGVTWAASVKWAGGTTPDLASGTLKRAICVFEWDGTYFLGTAGAY